MREPIQFSPTCSVRYIREAHKTQDMSDGDQTWYQTVHLYYLQQSEQCKPVLSDYTGRANFQKYLFFHPSFVSFSPQSVRTGKSVAPRTMVSLLVIEYCVSRGIRKEAALLLFSNILSFILLFSNILSFILLFSYILSFILLFSIHTSIQYYIIIYTSIQ